MAAVRGPGGGSKPGRPSRGPEWLSAACHALRAPAASFIIGLGCSGPEVDPAELQSIRAVGLAYLEENRLEEAAAEFSRLIELVPREPLGHANLGLAYLRMGRLEEAEGSVRTAMAMEASSEAALILGEILLAAGSDADARAELELALAADSLHPRVIYALANLETGTGPAAAATRASYLERLASVVPGNVAARIDLAVSLLAAGRLVDAETALEVVRQVVPEFPVEALDPFDEALLAAQASDVEAALNGALAFRNAMRTTPAYQRGLTELRGPGGVLTGFPVVTFSEVLAGSTGSEEAVLDALRFTDASEVLGLSALTPEAAGVGERHGALAVGDFDGDGDDDIYVGGRLLEDRPTGFTDVTAEAGLPALSDPLAAALADYDNDGRLDLFVSTDDEGRLFRGGEAGSFTETTASLGAALPAGAPLFGDFDHDGDLDLVVASSEEGTLLRNNLDGTFTDMGPRAAFAPPAGGDRASPAAARPVFGDLDDDDDLDFLVPGRVGGVRLHDNRRLGVFEEVAADRGLGGVGLRAIASADYNNDGWADLLGARTATGIALFLNRGDGSFQEDLRPSALLDAASELAVDDLAFMDFDNDGWLDVVLAGRLPGRGSGEAETTVLLFRNAAAGRFDPMPGLLPQAPALPVTRLVARDFGDDGDLDLILALADNTARLWRNDGGNANRYLKMALVGLSTGSGKNNHFGIGAKVEIRAGGLYQTRTMSARELHIGLGQHAGADVVRVRWTNGVPQNIFYPRANQSVVEEQILKGSCPFLYAWDGERFAMVTDLMWKSALGMPMGLMAQGDAEFAPSGASREYLRIAGSALEPRDGSYELRVTGELWEVFYLDEVELLALDHPDSFEVYVDERFAFVTGDVPLDIHRVTEHRPLAAATDHLGRDVLNELAHADDRYVADFIPERYQGVSQLHDLVLDLGPLPAGEPVALHLRGWIFPTDAGINVALSQSGELEAVMPYLQVPDGEAWRTIVPMLSFPAGKDKTIIQDLTGVLTPGDSRVRIRTTMNIYWDHAFVSVGEIRGSGEVPGPVELARLEPVRAELRHHGVATPFRRGGPDGPHWFDYDRAEAVSPWRPIVGNLTRYGDVRELLLADDSRYPIVGPGDEIALSFDAESLPALPEGWKRDFLIYTVGWLKDADLSTAEGWRVEPLPFHGMSAYPYGAHERYPHPGLVDSLHTRPPAAYPGLAGR